MLFSDRGVVLKTTDVGEKDKILTLYTENHGVLSVYSSGSRVVKSKLLAASDLFCFAEFVIYSKDEKQYSIREAQLINCFYNVRMDLSSMALGNYICEIARVTGTSDVPDPMFLRLVLNCLYALNKLDKPEALIKAVFELRAASLAGYTPDLMGCHICGNPQAALFDLSRGQIECSTCHTAGEQGIRMPITPGMLKAMRYILYCDSKKLFSFELGADAIEQLAQVTEGYLSTQLERSFSTLDFYKQLHIGDIYV